MRGWRKAVLGFGLTAGVTLPIFVAGSAAIAMPDGRATRPLRTLPTLAQRLGPLPNPTRCAVAGPPVPGLCGAGPRPQSIAWLFWKDDLEPRVFNASKSVKAGDIMFLQGANFDASTAVCMDDQQDADCLPIVGRVSDTWIAVKLPDVIPDPLSLRVKTDHGTSDRVKPNAADPWHIDATRLSAGSHFRVFGRNLKVGSHPPVVTLAGKSASVDVASSTDTMLVAIAPAPLPVAQDAVVTVDNGTGTGPTSLGVTLETDAGEGDPLGLEVSWGAGFDFGHDETAAKVECDGKADDSQAIQAAILHAAERGGGIVQLPRGTCRLGSTINMKSRVVLRGYGQQDTILLYEKNYPIYAADCDLLGLESLAIENAGGVQEGVTWKNNTRSFIKDVRLVMTKSRQWFLTGNRDFLFDHNNIVQTGSYDEQNPYRFDNSSGLIFSNNESINVSGSPTFQFVHDSVFINNHFTRDASSQDENPVVAHHQFVMDFCYRISIVGNTFDVSNGPVKNTLRNDGETLLVEGGGPFRTENIGTVQSSSAASITDAASTINPDPLGTGTLPENYGIVIVSGSGTGQARRVTGISGSTLTVDHDWDVVPDPGAHFSTFVWGLKDVLIVGNTLRDNPRGIWLYSTSVQNVAIEKNTIVDGGGIYLRSFQIMNRRWFNIQMNVDVNDNEITDHAGRWMSHIILANVRSEPEAFGTGEIGIAVRRNRVEASVPNVTSQLEEYASHEGYEALVHVEGGNGQLSDAPEMLGPIFQGNVCISCNKPFVIGTGVYGAIFSDNTPSASSPGALLDLQTFGHPTGGASESFIR